MQKKNLGQIHYEQIALVKQQLNSVCCNQAHSEAILTSMLATAKCANHSQDSTTFPRAQLTCEQMYRYCTHSSVRIMLEAERGIASGPHQFMNASILIHSTTHYTRTRSLYSHSVHIFIHN